MHYVQFRTKRRNWFVSSGVMGGPPNSAAGARPSRPPAEFADPVGHQKLISVADLRRVHVSSSKNRRSQQFSLPALPYGSAPLPRGKQRSTHSPESSCSLVLVDQASEDLAAFDPAERQADQVCATGGSSKVDREEVTRQRAHCVGADEVAPPVIGTPRCRAQTVPLQGPAYRRTADPVPETLQLASRSGTNGQVTVAGRLFAPTRNGNALYDSDRSTRSGTGLRHLCGGSRARPARSR
jgi:hypothetical protein